MQQPAGLQGHLSARFLLAHVIVIRLVCSCEQDYLKASKMVGFESEGISAKQYMKEGDVGLYTVANVRARQGFRHDPDVAGWLTRFYETFVTVDNDDAETMLQAQIDEVGAEVTALEKEKKEITSAMADLKEKLYKKFGNAINLEE